MTSEIDQRIVAGRPGGDLGRAEKSETNYLSRLPIELLDLIFELAASTDRLDLTILPISKSLFLSQERAIYKTIVLIRPETYSRLTWTLIRAQRRKGHHATRLVLCCLGDWYWPIDVGQLFAFLPNLLEIEFNTGDEATTFKILSQPKIVPPLRICRFVETVLTFSVVDCLSRIPTLRFVEVCSIETPPREQIDWSPARQVTQVAVHSGDSFGSSAPSLRQIFPSAHVSSVDIRIDNRDPVLPLSDLFDTHLLYLRLRSHDLAQRVGSIDHFLAQLSNLRHLHLDSPFVAPTLQPYLLCLPSLASLSLEYFDQDPNLDLLFANLHSIPHLSTLFLTYRNIRKGRSFDLGKAEDDWNHPDERDRDFGELSLSEDLTESFCLWDWKVTWGSNISEFIDEAVEMEEKAKAAGLVVQSNLSKLLRVFRLQVVEYYNRAVGALCFLNRREPLYCALSLARNHSLDIDRLEIDPEEYFDVDDWSEIEAVEWFEVRVDGIGGSPSEDRCYVYGLRSKRFGTM
ncbi:uncharacterized protein JCM6883_000512 [Sporobolomyces salmoneus]|uniref:uncharacterized protein n=1 Tax=Sporobolomyces salmoneus TaxID=183962 RepID=UPI003182AAA1